MNDFFLRFFVSSVNYLDLDLEWVSFVKKSKGAKIRTRYNQVPHLTKDTNGTQF